MGRIFSKKTIFDGIEFDSKDEAEFYAYLQTNKEELEIKMIMRQQEFQLIPPFQVDCFVCKGSGQVRGKRPGTMKNCTRCSGTGKKDRQGMNYTADFVLFYEDGTETVIDVKGYANEQFPVRKKVFEMTQQRPLVIVKRKGRVWQWR